MEMEKGTADAQIPCKLADIVATTADKRRDDPHAVRVGQGGHDVQPVGPGRVVEPDGGWALVLPDTAHAYAVWVDPDDKVWLTDWSINALVRFDPDTAREMGIADIQSASDNIHAGAKFPGAGSLLPAQPSPPAAADVGLCRRPQIGQ